MTESDPNGWETYSELPTQRFQHQYFDDTNLIKNMIFDLDVPTIGAIPGPGFHWDSAMLSDVTICSDDTWMEVPHAHGGLVPGDGMGLMAQHYFGTKRGNYYMMTARQWTAQQMLDWGMVSEVVPKDKVMERAWEIARLWKTMPYENRTIMSNLAKRPLKKLLVDDLKLHTVSEQYGSLLRIAAGEMGDTHAGQQDEKYISQTNDWRYCHDWMQQPPTRESWAGFRTSPSSGSRRWRPVRRSTPSTPTRRSPPIARKRRTDFPFSVPQTGGSALPPAPVKPISRSCFLWQKPSLPLPSPVLSPLRAIIFPKRRSRSCRPPMSAGSWALPWCISTPVPPTVRVL